MVTAAISLDVGALASAACIPSLTHALTEQQANKYVSAPLNLSLASEGWGDHTNMGRGRET